MYFIVNRTAGLGSCGKNFDIVKEYLDTNGISYSFAETKERNDEIRLTKEALKNGEKFIVAVGGDGTVRGVAGAMLGTDDTVLGILPFGTGNDLVKPLKIPTDPIEAIKNILLGHTRKMDAGRVNGMPFFNIAGTGFDVDVMVETERFKSKFKGMLPYLLGVLSAAFHKKRLSVEIELDGKKESGDMLMVNVANGTFFGGGMHIAPNADPFDGMFDVVMVKYVNLFGFFKLLPKVIKGTHIKSTKTVKVVRAKDVRITVTSGQEFPIQMDGEIDDVTPAHFELLKGAINIIVPKEEA